MIHRPQDEQEGCGIGAKDARQSPQIGTRLAVTSSRSQSRQGAGHATETSASRASPSPPQSLLHSLNRNPTAAQDYPSLMRYSNGKSKES